MKFGIALGALHPRHWVGVAVEADRLGFESVWISDHLVLPVDVSGSPFGEGEHPRLPPETPVYDAIGYLCHLAALTNHIRLGTYVYLMGLRHPFVTARGFATLDILSSGRALAGVGAGWLRGEWDAAGVDPAVRGPRLEEAIGVCRRLWTEPVVEHDGPHFPFAPVAFEPKPPQRPLPVHVGGTSELALDRAARLGDGWLGMHSTPVAAHERVSSLRALVAAAGRPLSAVEVTVSGDCRSPADPGDWSAAGVDRLIVTPWHQPGGTSTARDGVLGALRGFADLHF